MEKKAETPREYVVQEIERFNEIIDTSKRNINIIKFFSIPVCLGLAHGVSYWSSLFENIELRKLVEMFSRPPFLVAILCAITLIKNSLTKTHAVLRKDEYEMKLRLDEIHRNGDPDNARAREYVEKNIERLRKMINKDDFLSAFPLLFTAWGVVIKSFSAIEPEANKVIIEVFNWIGSMLIVYGASSMAISVAEEKCYESRIDNLESVLDLDEIKRTRIKNITNAVKYDKEGNPNG